MDYPWKSMEELCGIGMLLHFWIVVIVTIFNRQLNELHGHFQWQTVYLYQRLSIEHG